MSGEGPFDGEAQDVAAGATPLSIEERAGLRPSYIATRGQLNEAEQANILAANKVLFGRRRPWKPVDLAQAEFLRWVHRKMYGDVWSWAGEYRRSDKNIGVPWMTVPVATEGFLRDVRAFPPDELAIRFHHRMVLIHLFPNGNGRHSRAMADLMILSLGGTRFTWGGSALGGHDEVRRQYIAALREADRHEIGPLLVFART